MKIYFNRGKLMREFFAIPTIRFEHNYIGLYFFEFCWLTFYAGFKVLKEEK